MDNTGTIAVIAVIAAILIIAVVSALKHFNGKGGCCGGGGGEIAEDKKILTDPIIMTKLLRIQGMHCENCKKTIERRLNRLEGVLCEVNLETGTAEIKLAREISDKELSFIIAQLDFTVTEIITTGV